MHIHIHVKLSMVVGVLMQTCFIQKSFYIFLFYLYICVYTHCCISFLHKYDTHIIFNYTPDELRARAPFFHRKWLNLSVGRGQHVSKKPRFCTSCSRAPLLGSLGYGEAMYALTV